MTSDATASTKRPKIILVTDPAYKEERILEVVEACVSALPPRSFAVQLRDKKREKPALRELAQRLRAITKPLGTGGDALLLINGDAELAREVQADGVHLGGSSMSVAQARGIFGPGAFITIAAHSDKAVKLGADDGADGALVSAIFASPGKAAGRGVEAIRSARAVSNSHFALYGLGGVDRTNAAECILAGADGIAAIRALLLASDPGAEARAIYDSLHAT